MNETNAPLPAGPANAGPWPYGPMTFGQILDRIFALMRRRFWPFVGIASVPTGSIFLLYAALMATMAVNFPPLHAPPDPNIFVPLVFGVGFLATLPMAAIFALYSAAASWTATQADLGVKIGFRAAYAVALRRPWRFIGLMATIALIAFGPMLLLELGMFAATIPLFFGKKDLLIFVPFAVLPLGILLSMVWGVLVGLRLALAFPAGVVEDLSIWAAIGRSNQLAKGAKGRIFLVLLVIYAATYAALLAFGLIFLLLAAIVMLLTAPFHLTLVPWGYLLTGLAGLVVIGGLFLFYAAIWALYSVAFAVLYHDQRRREDGIATATPRLGEPA